MLLLLRALRNRWVEISLLATMEVLIEVTFGIEVPDAEKIHLYLFPIQPRTESVL
ncbi:MAG: hypothetical protein AAFY26_00740 [Cyanobacteria bacterium J06638_22]